MRKAEATLWLAMIFWGALAAWPANWWFDPGIIEVRDYRAGDTMEIVFTGGPVRSFIGGYSVAVRDAHSMEIVSEDIGGPLEYETDAGRPDPITIEWWAPRAFVAHHLRPGDYLMQTCWTVLRPFGGFVPAKTVCAETDVFAVHPEEAR
jgi:hypothetical protein